MTTPLPRFYCPDLPHPRLPETPCPLDADESHHARKVLRLAPGATVELFDGKGGLARARLLGYESRRALCQVITLDRVDPPRPHITIAAAVPKGARAEPMVNQLSQAGADRFVPLLCQRSVVTPREGKLERFNRHAIESAKQCGRLHAMAVEATRPFHDLLAEPADLRLLASPDAPPLDLANRLAAASSVLLLIGPEGGFTENELADAAAANVIPCPLGPYVMRIETAAVVAAALLRHLASQPQSQDQTRDSRNDP